MARKKRPGRKPKPRISPQAFADAIRPLIAFAQRRGVEDAFQEAAIEVWQRVARGDCAPIADAIAQDVKRRAWKRRIDLVRDDRGTHVFTDPVTGEKSRPLNDRILSLDAPVDDESGATLLDFRQKQPPLCPDAVPADPAAIVRFPGEQNALRQVADEWRRGCPITSLISQSNQEPVPSVRLNRETTTNAETDIT